MFQKFLFSRLTTFGGDPTIGYFQKLYIFAINDFWGGFCDRNFLKIKRPKVPDSPRLLKVYLYSIHSLFVWRECLAHQVPIVLTVLSFRFSGLCLMVVNATIHFHGQASPVGVWSFLRLPPNPSREKKKSRLDKFLK